MCVRDWQCFSFTPNRFVGGKIKLLKVLVGYEDVLSLRQMTICTNVLNEHCTFFCQCESFPL